MDESDDSKIRRNLVVFSTLVLLSAWLHISVGQIGKQIFTIDGTKLDPLDVWLACYAALMYLLVRYRFTSDWGEFDRTFKGNVLELKYTLIDKVLNNALIRYHRFGWDSRMFMPTVKKFCEHETAAMAEDSGKTNLHRALAKVEAKNHNNSTWGGLASMSFTWPKDDPRMTAWNVEHREVPYAIPVAHRIIITLRSYLQTMIYSKSSIHYIVPVLLASAAFAVMIASIGSVELERAKQGSAVPIKVSPSTQ